MSQLTKEDLIQSILQAVGILEDAESLDAEEMACLKEIDADLWDLAGAQ